MTPCKQAIGKSGTKNSLLQITHRLELEYDMQNGVYV